MSVFGDTCHVRSMYGVCTEQVRRKSIVCFLLNIMNMKSKGNEICHLILQNDSFPKVPLVEMNYTPHSPTLLPYFITEVPI